MSKISIALRRAQGEITAAYNRRDKLIQEAHEKGMSRREIANATGLAKSRIDQILRGE